MSRNEDEIIPDSQTATDTRPEPSSSGTDPYTTLTRRQKHLLIFLLGLSCTTSPLTANIYFPLLPLLRQTFSVSAQAINQTLTVYIIFQALSPAVFGPLSDTVGRRPVYLLTLSIYLVACVGLALNRHSYAGLLVLRALQSIGASAAFAVSYGVIADVCVPSERGRMLGPVSAALNLGTCVGPVVGGLVAYESGGFVWVFWALVIVAALLVVLMSALLPETARSLVGNGSCKFESKGVSALWDMSLWDLARRRRHLAAASAAPQLRREDEIKDIPCRVNAEQSPTRPEPLRRRFRLHNPLSPLLILLHLDIFLALWLHASFYTVDYAMVAVLPDIYLTSYGFNQLQVGLAYLPRGLGIIVGGYCNGRLMDHNYAVVARQISWTIDTVRGDDLSEFPIERARSRSAYILLVISTGTLVTYGWVVTTEVHVVVPLLLQFIQGFWGTCFYTTFSALLTDVFPESPSTAAAAASVGRCAMAATGMAILQPLLDAVGRGWYFTALGLWSGVLGAGAAWLMRRSGMHWRRKRL